MFLNDFKYNYIIYSVNQDYFTAIFEDVITLENVEYIPHPITHYNYNFFVRKLYEIHHNGYLNRFFSLPFKSFWNVTYFKDTFKGNRPKCFVFFMGWLNKDKESYFRYLKKRYTDCVLVVYFEDLISSRRHIDLNLIPKYFDLAISYDMEESLQLGVKYYPTSFSHMNIEDDSERKRTDIHFCGAAKNRYQDILDVYKILVDSDVNCDFNVARLQSQQKKIDGIHYISYAIPYKDYLKQVKASNCILEIIQKKSSGYTLRTWEALAFGKKMITNNKEILNAPFYTDSQFAYFQKPEDIDIKFIQSKLNNPDATYIKNLSPVKFLEFIESNLINK